ncbi:MAG: hypothetical protein U0992_23240 [Planctomycetaceae bacterium]
MSDTSHAVGRITILAATTLIFAAAWRGDESGSSRPTISVAWSRRSSEDAGNSDSSGPVTNGLRASGGGAVEQYRIGALGQRAVQPDELASLPVQPVFSGAPAFLGRSTTSIASELEPRTAVARQAAADLE